MSNQKRLWIVVNIILFASIPLQLFLSEMSVLIIGIVIVLTQGLALKLTLKRLNLGRWVVANAIGYIVGMFLSIYNWLVMLPTIVGILQGNSVMTAFSNALSWEHTITFGFFENLVGVLATGFIMGLCMSFAQNLVLSCYNHRPRRWIQINSVAYTVAYPIVFYDFDALRLHSGPSDILPTIFFGVLGGIVYGWITADAIPIAKNTP